MINIEDFDNVIGYFEEHEIPENLTNFIAKLRIMREEILYRKESQEKLKYFNDELLKLSEQEKKGE